MLIKSILEFRMLAMAGFCGNTPEMWSDICKCQKQIGSRTVFITSWHKECDAFNLYHASKDDVDMVIRSAQRTGLAVDAAGNQAPIETVYCMEVPAKSKQESVACFQADWISDSRSMIWNVSNQPWGRCKRAGQFQSADGLLCDVILRRHLDARDIDELHALGERFPGAVIEFTKFPWAIGIYGQGPLIWEVRHY